MSEIAILLPLYNAEKFLFSTLKTLQNQSFDDFELVIIDDGSTDNWQEIYEQFSFRNAKIFHQENQGLVSALNFGLQQIDAKYIARADADDLYHPHRLAWQWDYAEFARADAVSSRVQNINEKGEIIGEGLGQNTIFHANPHAVPAKEPYLLHPFMMIKTAVLHEIGGYRQFHLAEDADLCWRLFENHHLAVSEKIAGFYRIHQNSISARSVGHSRVQAFYGELAALNARRRAAGLTELLPMGDLNENLTRSGSFEEIILPYELHLGQEEHKALLCSSVAKFLDLAKVRGLVLSAGDLKLAESYQDLVGKLHQESQEPYNYHLWLAQEAYKHAEHAQNSGNAQEIDPS